MRVRVRFWWFQAALGVGFWYLAYLYLTIPDVRTLASANPTTTAFIERRLAEAGAEGRALKIRRQWADYRRMSAALKRAVLVAEDSAFWDHDGIDFEQIRESMEYNLERGEFRRGASTITQQLAKNLYLSPSRNPARKVRELMIARRLEAVLSKRRILELYLNLVEWGDGVFGAEAAARTHFGVGAGALTAEQSALLAGSLINPRLYSPSRPPPRLLRRQRMLLRRMGAARAAPPSDEASAPGPTHEPAAPREPLAQVPADAEPPPATTPPAGEAPPAPAQADRPTVKPPG